MTKQTRALIISLALLLIALILHGALTLNYYPLKLGTAEGQSKCNVSQTFNCDVVSVSPYSSVFDIPLSVWGFSFHVVLLIVLLVAFFGLTENKRSWNRWGFYLASLSAVTSLVMGVLSVLLLDSYCLYCIGAYLASFLLVWSTYQLNEEPPLQGFAKEFQDLFSDSKALLVVLALVPIMAYLGHQRFMQSYGGDRLQVFVNSSIGEWKISPKSDFNAPITLVKGPSADDAVLTIVEFADFRCGHCQRAAPTLSAFSQANSETVRLEFYSFPLDSQCNPEISSGDGISCRMAKASYCGGKQDKQKGWQLHDKIFANALTLGWGSLDGVDNSLEEMTSELSLAWQELKDCMDSNETHEAILAQVQSGVEANVKGTPSIFANGRRLPRGQMIPVLKRALEEAKKGM